MLAETVRATENSPENGKMTVLGCTETGQARYSTQAPMTDGNSTRFEW